MADVKSAYGAVTAITITPGTLASGSSRESTFIDNTVNKFQDALVMILVRINGAPTGDKAVYVNVYGTADPATPKWPDNVTGVDAAITLVGPTQLPLLGTINTPATLTNYRSRPFTIAPAFGGVMPAKWGIIITNAAGQPFDNSAFEAFYQGIYSTVG